MHEQFEREQKWDVGGAFTLPRLDDVVSGADVDTDVVELASTYYDTADYDLRAHGLVMRHRVGDIDSGWQVKMPHKDGRLELHWAASERPPDDLSRILEGAALGKPLINVVTIRTERRRHRVNVAGALQFELAEDAVRASREDTMLAWRKSRSNSDPTCLPRPRSYAAVTGGRC